MECPAQYRGERMTVADRFNKFIEDIKTDKKVQTLTAGIVFFLIAFPSVFAVMANGGSEGGAMGGVGTYNVSDTITNIPFDSGEQEISNGDDFMIDLNTDNIPSGENIVGVVITLTYSENEESASGPFGAPCFNQDDGADTISASATKGENTADGSGTNQGGSGEHSVIAEWYNSSLLSGDIEGMSESEINSQLDAGTAGYGDYSFIISVEATTGQAGAGCSKSDDTSELVSWNIELISLEYEINRVISEE